MGRLHCQSEIERIQPRLVALLRLRAALLWWKIARFRLQLPLAAVNPQKESERMAGEGCWEALPSVLKLEDLLSPSWRKFETSFERERQSRYKKYITHCRHVHRLIVHGLLRCCGFFPLQCRVDPFHSATQCCPFCFTMLWSLSTSEPQSLLSFLLCCACAALQLSGTQPNAKPWKLRRAQLPRLVKHKCQAYCKQSNTNVEDLSQRNVSIRTNW